MWLAPVGGDMATEQDMAERAAVTTYVPAYQRDVWDDHADELDMSRSEFVRSMVQAGRKGFDPRGWTGETASQGEDSPRASDTDRADLEDRVRTALADGPQSWEDLLDEVTDDVEARLESALGSLQEKDDVRYSGPDGGYVLVQ